MTCITISPTKPKEEGTAVITMTFLDEDGDTVVPSDLEWELSTVQGTIINNRDFTSGSFTGDTVVLQGDDLALLSVGDDGVRRFGVQGTYNSDAGSDLPLKDEFEFFICKLVTQGDY